MRGWDFLEVAQFLESLQTEASLRAQIGRIYYAAYLEARSWCETNLGYQRERLGREHIEIPRMLALIDPDLPVDLAFLRTYRNTADYDLHVSTDTLALEHVDALKRAAHVRERLDTLEIPGPMPEH